jgi:hypothetical protein
MELVKHRPFEIGFGVAAVGFSPRQRMPVPAECDQVQCAKFDSEILTFCWSNRENSVKSQLTLRLSGNGLRFHNSAAERIGYWQRCVITNPARLRKQ